tara:strand:- start:66 stop:170 length:105 start_codon:yes stop_codon:yes gene_type:complete
MLIEIEEEEKEISEDYGFQELMHLQELMALITVN